MFAKFNTHNEKELNLPFTGPFHPLGAGLFFIRLGNAPRSKQGLCSQLVRLPEGWVLLDFEIHPVQNKEIQPLMEKTFEVLEESRARNLAVKDGQEEIFSMINAIVSSQRG